MSLRISEEGYMIIALIIFLLGCLAISILDEIFTRKFIRESRIQTEKFIQENNNPNPVFAQAGINDYRNHNKCNSSDDNHTDTNGD